MLAARIALEAGEPFRAGSAWWCSGRRIRSASARPAPGHVPDAEVHWPDVAGSPYPGECWAVEAELTPKGTARTARIMTGLLARLLDALPLLGDILGDASARLQQLLYDAFSIQLLYKHGMRQVTIFADITDSTPDALAAIINNTKALNAPVTAPRQPEVLDLLQRPIGRSIHHDHEERVGSPG